MKQTHQQTALSVKEKIAKAASAKPKRNQFLISLYNALEKPQYENAMCWDLDGRAFILKNPAFIAERILMEEFSGMKFTSFIRQLSYYGFKRVSRRANVKVYSHEQFRRDRKDFLKQIKRNHKDIENTKVTASEPEEHHLSETTNDVVETMDRKISYLQAELEQMRAENMALRSCVQTLSKKLYEQNSDPSNEDMNSQIAPSNGFCQTFFNPQAKSYYPVSNSIPENPTIMSNVPNFIEAYQPDCKVHQPKFLEKNIGETTDSHHMDTPLSEDNEINNFFNHSKEESFEDDYWRNGEQIDYEF